MKSLFCEKLAACLCMKQLPSPSLELGLKEDEKKNDWQLAAAVLNRICAIVFTVIVVGGTVIFFLLFAMRP